MIATLCHEVLESKKLDSLFSLIHYFPLPLPCYCDKCRGKQVFWKVEMKPLFSFSLTEKELNDQLSKYHSRNVHLQEELDPIHEHKKRKEKVLKREKEKVKAVAKTTLKEAEMPGGSGMSDENFSIGTSV